MTTLDPPDAVAVDLAIATRKGRLALPDLKVAGPQESPPRHSSP
jgi:hypothetical protein